MLRQLTNPPKLGPLRRNNDFGIPMNSAEFKSQLQRRLLGRPRQELQVQGNRPAAVVVPLVESDTGWQLLFTVRSKHLQHHAGQISFPGGTLERDETPVQAAVREMREEIGISAQSLLGQLDDQPSPAGFVVTPMIAIVPWPQKLVLNQDEVEEAFTVPLKHFQQTKPRQQIRRLNQSQRTIYFYDYLEREIWGLTANIVHNLLEFTPSV